jgi:hypothetical protein
MKYFVLLMACCACTVMAKAQNKPANTALIDSSPTTDSAGHKAKGPVRLTVTNAPSSKTKDSAGNYYLALGPGGLKVSSKKKDSINNSKDFHVHFIMVDVGINAFKDGTNYGSPAAQQYLQVPANSKNSNLFSMRTSKSINVNVWPVLFDYDLLKSHSQKISLYSGVGMQFYNFRFNKDISYLNETTPMIIEDSVKFSKNKLSFAYASIPLMLNFKTRMAKGFWLVYGFGATGGYAFDTWTKQISEERGKQKNHDQFNFQRFNLNLSGEIGIDNYIRLYGTYQVTNMYKNSLVQNPYCIGIRFFGI